MYDCVFAFVAWSCLGGKSLTVFRFLAARPFQARQDSWQAAPAARPAFPEIMSRLEDMQFVFSLAASSRSEAAPGAYARAR